MKRSRFLGLVAGVPARDERPSWSMLSDDVFAADGSLKGYDKDTPVFAGLKPEYQKAAMGLVNWAARKD